MASGLSAYDDSWDDRRNRKLPSEILYVVVRDKKVSSIFSVPVEICPAQGNKVFGGSWNGRCFVGVGRDVYEFREKEGHWKEMKSTKKRREYSSSCNVDQKGIIVVGGWEGSGRSSAEVFNCDNKLTTSSITSYGPKFLSTFKLPPSLSKRQDNVKCSTWKKCSSRIPVSLNDGTPAQIWGHTITYVGDNRMMLVGGRALSQRPYRRETTKCVFGGELTKDNLDIKWEILKPLSTDRFGHFAFKLKNYLYVAGGAEYGVKDILCCEMYDIDKRFWSISKHSLPYHLYKASVIVDNEENFALIIGGLKRTAEASSKVILFTEENGFAEVENFNLYRKRYGHVSLPMSFE